MADDPIKFDVLDAATALPAARLGEMSGLSERVRDGAHLSAEERDFIADFLLGNVKIDRSTAKRQQKVSELVDLGWFVLAIQAYEGGPLNAALHDAEALLGTSRRKLQYAVDACREQPGASFRLDWLKRLEDRASQLRKSSSATSAP